MITDKQVVEATKTLAKQYSDNEMKARELLEQYEQSKWIRFDPTDKSTWPKDEDTYIVFNDHSKQTHPAVWLTPEKQWSFDGADYLETITHWQPLP